MPEAEDRESFWVEFTAFIVGITVTPLVMVFDGFMYTLTMWRNKSLELIESYRARKAMKNYDRSE